MRTVHAAAATVASAALLGFTAEPANDRTHERAPADMPEGRLVLGLHPPERVAVLDVASGALRERRLPGGTLCHGPLMVSGRTVFFLGSRRGRGALMSSDLALEQRFRVVSWSQLQSVPSARSGAFWAFGFRYEGRRAKSSAPREVTPSGTVLFRSRRQPPAGHPMAATAEGIVLEHRSRTRIWDPRTGAVRPTPGFWMIAASHDRSVWCGQRCRRLRLEGPGGMLTAQRLPGGWSFSPGSGSLSADGSLLAVSAHRERRPYRARIVLVHTVDGAVELLPAPLPAGRGEVAWSRSGEWLYVATENRRIAAYRPRDQRVVTLPIRLADDVIELSVAD